MFKLINRIYLLSAIFLYIMLSSKVTGEYLLINIFAVLSFISYYAILYFNTTMNVKYYTNYYLLIEVFVYILIFVIIYNFISYFYHDNFYVFSESDAIYYHESTSNIVDMPILDAIEHYLKYYMGFDDLGMILVLYPLYSICESNLMLNFFYLFVGLVTAFSLFRLSQNFMTKKYAFLSSLSYSVSSFVAYFHSIGLKESFMIMLVVLSFDFYYRFMQNKNFISLINALIFIGLILLFRPAILAMIIVAIGLGLVLKRGFGFNLFSLVMVILLIVASGFISQVIEKNTTGGIDTLIAGREEQGMIKGGIMFTYAVNILSQAIGPLPTIVTDTKIATMFYSTGLIYRILLAFPFWLGVIHIYKSKNYNLYPLMIFVIMEMSSLAFIMDGLELRVALPHIPIVFVVAFWFLNQYDMRIIQFKKVKVYNLLYIFSIFITLMMFYWNYR